MKKFLDFFAEGSVFWILFVLVGIFYIIITKVTDLGPAIHLFCAVISWIGIVGTLIIALIEGFKSLQRKEM